MPKPQADMAVPQALASKVTVVTTVTYTAEAAPGTALSAASWRAKKYDSATGLTQWADGNGNFDNVATDLTALTYS